MIYFAFSHGQSQYQKKTVTCNDCGNWSLLVTGHTCLVVGVDLRVVVDAVIVVALVTHNLRDVVLDCRRCRLVGLDGPGVPPALKFKTGPE